MATKKPIFSVGVNVQLWPGDTRYKYGKILEIDNTGWTFEITKSNAEEYPVGSIIFISHSKSLSMKLDK